MAAHESKLLKVLRIGRDTSARGEGISLKVALARTKYKELRRSFAPHDLVPLIQAHPDVIEDWISYSENKRTSGGWYVLRDGGVGAMGDREPQERFAFLANAVAEYVVRELDFWVSTTARC